MITVCYCLSFTDRRTCHSAVHTAAGWIIPIDKLIETAQIHVKGCNIYRTVGNYEFGFNNII